MAARNVLNRIAEERQESLDQMIPRLLNELGTMYAVSVELGVYPNTILNWLSKHNYRYDTRKKTWLKKRTRKTADELEYQPLETIA